MEEGGKLPAAIAAAKELISLSDPSGLITLIGFDDEAYPLCGPTPVDRAGEILARLPHLTDLGGGTTNMSVALDEAVAQIQSVPDDGRARVIIFLSDGADNACKPDVIAAGLRAAEANIQIYAVGMGEEFEADFLHTLVSCGGGTVFGQAEVARVREAFIDLAATLSNVVATQVQLELAFAPGVFVGKSFKVSPDQGFLGHVRLGPDRRHLRRLGGIERDRQCQMLFRVRVPAGRIGRFELATVRLRYDVPSLRIRGEEVAVPVHFEVGPTASLQDGGVLECLRRVQLTELVERFAEAHRAGRAVETARCIDQLIAEYGLVNDTGMVKHYCSIREDLRAGGRITRAAINASVVASTIARDGGAIRTLVDDGF
jgi:hypothetical protein